MTIDPGAKQDSSRGPTFTQQRDIPDWISKAYIESYRGPHGDESGGGTRPIDLTVPAGIVTPAMLSAHYRLGAVTVPPARAASRSTRRTTPPGSGPRCKSSPTTAAC